MNISEQRLAEIVGQAVSQALSERRQEVATHVCFCSDPQSKARHDEEHAIIRRVAVMLDRVDKTKWGFLLIAGGLIAGTLWDAVKGLFK